MILRNPAALALISAIALFWFSDYALGTSLNRDAVDLVGMAFSGFMGMRLMPDAIDRFKRGGGQRNWQLLMGNFLLYWGWFLFSGWAFMMRGVKVSDPAMYDWMAASPINGFLRFWILGGVALGFFATDDTPRPTTPTRMYYISIGVVGGVLLGFVLSKYIPLE